MSKLFTAPDARVLIIDNSSIGYRILKSMLRPYALEAEHARSVNEALEGCLNYDLIFIEYMALESVEELLDRTSEIPIVGMLQAKHLNEPVYDKLVELGITDYLLKPINLKRLHKSLLRYLSPSKIMCKDLEEPISHLYADSILNLSNVDTISGLNNTSGDLAAYIRILSGICYSGWLSEPSAFSGLTDVDMLLRETCSIKNSAKFIGAKQILEQAVAIEQACFDNDLKYLRNNTGDLRESLDTLVSDIRELLMANGPEKNKDVSGAVNHVNLAINAIGEYDLEAALEQINYLEGYMLTPEQEELLKAARESAYLFVYDITAIKLSELLEMLQK